MTQRQELVMSNAANARDLEGEGARLLHRFRSAKAGNLPGLRLATMVLLGTLVLAPVLLIFYQSFLDGAFFNETSRPSLDSFAYVLGDPAFYRALKNTLLVALGMTAVAVPIGGALAFLLTRSDLPCKPLLEILVLLPAFISSIVLAFGYVISMGPSGFVSLALRQWLGFVPWNLYSLTGIVIVAGISHVPYAYLYLASAMRQLPSDLEEAARVAGASVPRVLIDVTLPMVLPAFVFATALIFLAGFGLFGVTLVLGDAQGIEVLMTYMHKLTIIFGVPAYHLMAVVAALVMLMTGPIVLIQRRLVRNAERYAAISGKAGQATPVALGRVGRPLALAAVLLWLAAAVLLPLAGICLRAFVDAWGVGINPFEHLTLAHFNTLFEVPRLSRAIANTVVLATVGGLGATFLYLLVGLATHRTRGAANAVLDALVLLPKALPKLVLGLAFFWLFLFVPLLQPLRLTLISIFVAYAVVGHSYGLRLIQSVLLQIRPELEESARVCGATLLRTWWDVTIPLARPGIVGAWALIMLLFIRDYSTGVYLVSSGTEVIGALLVSLQESGGLDIISALSMVSVLLTGMGIGLALRLGGRLNV